MPGRVELLLDPAPRRPPHHVPANDGDHEQRVTLLDLVDLDARVAGRLLDHHVPAEARLVLHEVTLVEGLELDPLPAVRHHEAMPLVEAEVVTVLHLFGVLGRRLPGVVTRTNAWLRDCLRLPAGGVSGLMWLDRDRLVRELLGRKHRLLCHARVFVLCHPVVLLDLMDLHTGGRDLPASPTSAVTRWCCGRSARRRT